MAFNNNVFSFFVCPCDDDDDDNDYYYYYYYYRVLLP